MKEQRNLDEVIEEIQKTIYKYNLPPNIHIGTLMNILYFLKEQEAQRDYEASIEMAEYCERYERTYNPEDGSM